MGIRLGDRYLTPNYVFVAVGRLYFLLLARQALRPHFAPHGLRHALAAAGTGALAGAWLAATAATALKGELQWHPAGLFDVRFSSIGGSWGCLLGLALHARSDRQAVLPVLDAVVPALLVGLIASRLGCLFGGCCRGILRAFNLAGLQLQPFELWPLWDLAALGVTLALGALPHNPFRRAPAGSGTLLLLGYGLLRFLVEYLRFDPRLGGNDALPMAGRGTGGLRPGLGGNSHRSRSTGRGPRSAFVRRRPKGRSASGPNRGERKQRAEQDPNVHP